jgi:hypothetical protein
MSDLLAFVAIGFRHITDLAAMDHILFLLALAAVYRGREWRDALWVISAFTVGHSMTLALAVTGTLPLSAPVVEFLIPVTIVATAVANVAESGRAARQRRGTFRAVLAGVFGLVHGAGFAGYLTSLFVDPIAVPLFGFNVGIELGQIVVLAIIGAALAAIDWTLRRAGPLHPAASPLRLRVVTLSLLVGVVAAEWAVERRPW